MKIYICSGGPWQKNSAGSPLFVSLRRTLLDRRIDRRLHGGE